MGLIRGVPRIYNGGASQREDPEIFEKEAEKSLRS